MQVLPFVRQIMLPERREADILLGFSLPFLPDMLTSRWLSGTSPHARLDEALRLQVQLLKRLWSQGIAAWDLRFIGSDDQPGVSIGLLCRLSRPPQMPPDQLYNYSQHQAVLVQQLFADFGYELLPLSDEASLMRYLSPFRPQALGEIRRFEDLVTAEDAYTEYEFYVPYPWHWTQQNRLRLFEALLQRQSSCLVSVCLEPTRLSIQEQQHLSHATSSKMKHLLRNIGPRSETIYNIYSDYARSLQRPYVVRITVAAATPHTMQQIAWRLREELQASQVIDPLGRAVLNELHTTSDAGPILAVPQNPQEWNQASQSLFNLAWLPWGRNEGMALPGTARLRYLMDDVAASMAFRLPVAHVGDLPGTPVRSLMPTMSMPPTQMPSTQWSPGTRSTSLSPHITATGQNISHFSTTPVGQKTPILSSYVSIERPEDIVHKTLGTCVIEDLIGQGGFGAVYRARQETTNRQVAVKVILASHSHGSPEKLQKTMQRFDREAQAIARLDHPNIITLYEYQREPFPYIVMPYVAGGSLADERTASGRRPLPVSGVAMILHQVASALDHAHQQRLVHRDIKPHNLLRHSDGRILLSDFGIVLFDDDEYTALTRMGEYSPHTPAYASPEQHQMLTLDARSDIYSLGVVIYELLCGQRPFSSPIQQLQAPPPPMKSHGVSIRPEIEAVVMKALARSPDQRYQSAGEMARDFQKFL